MTAGEKELDYVKTIPEEVPVGKILIHNGVWPPSWFVGTRGSRMWLDEPDDDHYVVCRCGWIPTLGDHYRVVHPDADHEQAIKDQMPIFQAMARGYASGIVDLATVYDDLEDLSPIFQQAQNLTH